MTKFLSIAEFEAEKKKKPESVEGCKLVLSVSEFEAMYQKDPKQVAGYYVSKKDFFTLTVLREMTDEGAAEATYQRWLMGKRVSQEQELVLTDGTTEDKLAIFIECRFVNAERRRDNKNKAIIAESKKIAVQDLAAAFRN